MKKQSSGVQPSQPEPKELFKCPACRHTWKTPTSHYCITGMYRHFEDVRWETDEGQPSQPEGSAKPVKERSNIDLLELVCQLHYRAVQYPSEDMHDSYAEARKELELRLTPKAVQSKEDILKDKKDQMQGKLSAIYWETTILAAMEEYAAQTASPVSEDDWISVKDRFPECAKGERNYSVDIEAKFENGEIVKGHFELEDGYLYDEETMCQYQEKPTYWRHLPSPVSTQVQGVKEFIEKRIGDLKELDAGFCIDRWDMSLATFQRDRARNMSNETTARRHELEDLLKHFPTPQPTVSEQVQGVSEEELKQRFARHLQVEELDTRDAYAVEWMAKKLSGK